MHVEGLQQALGVGVGGFITHHKALCDLPIAEATGEQVENLVLAWRKPRTAQIRQDSRPQGGAAVGVTAKHGHHGGLQWLLISHEVGLSNNGFQPGCIDAFGGNRIPKDQDHGMELRMKLAGLADQIETVA